MMSILRAWCRSIAYLWRKIWSKPTADELYRSVVRLYRTTDTLLVGGGFFIYATYVLTCVHVVNRALKRDDSNRKMPNEVELVSLRHDGSTAICEARVVCWRPAGQDIAILEVCDPVDNGHPPPCSAINNLSNHRFQALGFPSGYDQGVITRGRINGTRLDGLVQLEVDRDAPYRIEAGFSGMPVWSETAQAVVGMIMEADRDPEKNVGFMVPLSRLESIQGFSELIAGNESESILWTPQPAVFSVHPETFLEYFTQNATAERELLSAFFVTPGIFPALKQPISQIVYGADGYGKTAVCLMLKTTLQDKGDCLVIYFDHFEYFSNNEVNLDTWLGYIQRELLHMLLEEMRRSESRKSQFLRSCQAKSRAHFWAACRWSRIQQDLIELPENHREVLSNYHNLDSISKFDILSQIAHNSGFQKIYMFLDGLNNYIKGYNDGLTLISPLLARLDPLQQRGFAVKFFLPQSMNEGIDVPDGLRTYELQWEPEQLRQMLANRLQNRSNPFRPNTRLETVQCFADLCVPGLVDVDGRLIQAANGSPRRLMQLACAILEHHCQHDWSADRISAATIEAVLEAMRSDD